MRGIGDAKMNAELAAKIVDLILENGKYANGALIKRYLDQFTIAPTGELENKINCFVQDFDLYAWEKEGQATSYVIAATIAVWLRGFSGVKLDHTAQPEVKII